MKVSEEDPYNDGFSAHELNRIRALIVANREAVVEAWDEHCGYCN